MVHWGLLHPPAAPMPKWRELKTNVPCSHEANKARSASSTPCFFSWRFARLVTMLGKKIQNSTTTTNWISCRLALNLIFPNCNSRSTRTTALPTSGTASSAACVSGSQSPPWICPWKASVPTRRPHHWSSPEHRRGCRKPAQIHRDEFMQGLESWGEPLPCRLAQQRKTTW